MSKTPPDITPAEFNVMKALWRLGQGTVADIRAKHADVYDSDLAYTTVMTLLSRLAAKGAVRVDKARQPYVYKPAFRESSVVRARLRQFVETVFDGEAGSLVLSLVEDETLTLDDLRHIERKIEDEEQD